MSDTETTAVETPMTADEYEALYDMLRRAVSETSGDTTTEGMVAWHALCAAKCIAHARFLDVKYERRP